MSEHTLEERIAFLERDVTETREVLGLVVSYLRLQHGFDGEDFLKWCRFQNSLLADEDAAFSLMHTVLEITEYADTALGAQEGRISYRAFSDRESEPWVPPSEGEDR